MKKFIVIAVLVSMYWVGCYKVEHDPMSGIDTMSYNVEDSVVIDSIECMFNAFSMQESRMAPHAVSPCGTYVGIAQIGPSMIAEANRIAGFEAFNLDDRYDPMLSLAVFTIVMQHHNPELDIDKAIKIWNHNAPESYRNNVKGYYINELNKYNQNK